MTALLVVLILAVLFPDIVALIVGWLIVVGIAGFALLLVLGLFLPS